LLVEVAKQQLASQGRFPSLPPDDAEPDPKYRATLDWVWSFSARPRTPEEMAAQRAVKLERMRTLLDQLDHPEQRFSELLVAGTKGKGSTVAMLSACLQLGGYRTGRYTSPHLVNWRERICVDAEPISPDVVIDLAEPIGRAIDKLPPSLGTPTTFEVGTAFALLEFARQRVDVAVLEVGTGGRFDATNVVEPLVSVITPISYDHTQTLGVTLASIAWHKSGILRSGRPAITAPQVPEALEVIEREAARLGTPLDEVGRDWRWRAEAEGIVIDARYADFRPLRTGVGLLGSHQRDNATTTVAVLHSIADRLPLSRAAIQTGLKDVDWPGRLQVLANQPLIVLDGAHNAASAEVVRRALEDVFTFDRLMLVVGLSEGKDAVGVLRSLAPRAHAVYVTRSHNERSVPPSELEPLARSAAPRAEVTAVDNLPAAMAAAQRTAGPRDMILVTGSLFLVGEALVLWRRSPQ
jgi:dihydrofolate synthase/folylpolyglutamate synthase